MKKIHHDISPPLKIKTILYKVWQEKNFSCSRSLLPVVVKILLERLDRRMLKKYEEFYRNPWFLVAKKKSEIYRLINTIMKINSVMMKDANMSLSINEFSEKFVDCHYASLIDFFSGYNQLDLDIQSRDLTAFIMPLKLLRMTTLPQEATNLV